MSDWFNWLAYDILGTVLFSKAYNCLESAEYRRMPVVMTEATKFGYWFAHLPFGSPFLQMVATTPVVQWLAGQAARENAIFVSYAMSQFEERAALEKERQQRKKDQPAHKDIMHYLLNHRENSLKSKTDLQLTTEEQQGDALSLLGAGSDTTATILAASLFYLCRNESVLSCMQSEVRSAFNGLEEICSGPKMDSCRYLNACIEETLRLCPPVASLLPREVMKGGTIVDGCYIPEGTIIGVSAYVVHHDEQVFPGPWKFRPERLIPGSHFNDDDDHAADNTRGPLVVSKEDIERARAAMCPFPLGSRGCIGKTMAYIEMRITLASLTWVYDFQEVGETGDSERKGGSGGGGSGLEEGRERMDEYQLFDCFGADRDGPVLRFRKRSEVE